MDRARRRAHNVASAQRVRLAVIHQEQCATPLNEPYLFAHRGHMSLRVPIRDVSDGGKQSRRHSARDPVSIVRRSVIHVVPSRIEGSYRVSGKLRDDYAADGPEGIRIVNGVNIVTPVAMSHK